MVITSLFVVLTAFVGIHDALTKRIPNKAIIALFLLYALHLFIQEAHWSHRLEDLLVPPIVVVALLPFHTRGIIGGGDIKLIAALGCWYGLRSELVTFALIVAILGGAISLAGLVIRQTGLLRGMSAGRLVEDLHGERPTVPYGVAIALAALIFPPPGLVPV